MTTAETTLPGERVWEASQPQLSSFPTSRHLLGPWGTPLPLGKAAPCLRGVFACWDTSKTSWQISRSTAGLLNLGCVAGMKGHPGLGHPRKRLFSGPPANSTTPDRRRGEGAQVGAGKLPGPSPELCKSAQGGLEAWVGEKDPQLRGSKGRGGMTS